MSKTLITTWEAQYRDRVIREGEGVKYADLPPVGLVAFRLMYGGTEAFATYPPPGLDRPNFRYRIRHEDATNTHRFVVGWVPGPATVIDLDIDESWVWADGFHDCPEGTMHAGHPGGWFSAPQPMGSER